MAVEQRPKPSRLSPPRLLRGVFRRIESLYRFLLKHYLRAIRYASFHFKPLRRFYFWTAYRRRPAWDTGVSPIELLAFIEEHPPGRALEFGCGTGTNAVTLAQHGWQVTALDFMPKVVDRARLKARDANVEVDFRTADVTQPLNLTPTYDLVLDIGCLHSLDVSGRTGYLQNLSAALAPGGTYLLYAFTGYLSRWRPTVSSEDVQRIPFELIRRKDGSERGIRPSAWFTFLNR